MASTRSSRTRQDSSTTLGGDSANAAVQPVAQSMPASVTALAAQGMPTSVTAVATQGTPVTLVTPTTVASQVTLMTVTSRVVLTTFASQVAPMTVASTPHVDSVAALPLDQFLELVREEVRAEFHAMAQQYSQSGPVPPSAGQAIAATAGGQASLVPG